MNIASALYTLIIGPLKLLFEVIYTLAYYVTGSAGLSIIALSLVMNVLLLPLYNMADALQEKENQIQLKLKKGVDHIKKSFKGDEQYMILNTYYRQNGYKPIYALRTSVSLLLEIPFFIAAYDFLSNEYTVLSASFGPISSLGNPDGLLGGINLLPILMTVINIVSSAIYTKGQPLKNNIQLYVMALAFLVFLYDRPAGLVFYWTLNNVFSLIKNILARLKNSDLIISILCSLVSLAGIGILLFVHPLSTMTMQIGALVLLVALQLPLVLYYAVKKKGLSLNRDDIAIDHRIFYGEIIFLIVLFGLYIPCDVIGSSPSEFVDMNTMVNPLTYMFNSFLLVAGTFGLWVYIYYALMSNPIKKDMQVVLLFVCILSAVDFALFGRNMGTMSNMLIYDSGISYSSKEALYNALAVLLVMVLVYLLFRRKNKILIPALVISIISMSVYSASNIFSIQREVKEALASIEESRSDLAQIELSKSGKNVVIIILDRAVGFYLPYIMNEKPELQKTYDGFTFYPNTISYGPSTNMGMPPVYGGYEYLPEEMNKRDDELLVDKNNEALKVLPVLFDENGYDVTVLDPCYAGYRDPEDLSIYDQYPDIKKWNTQSGMFDYDRSIVKNNLEELNRNLFCFGLTKAVPVFMQNILYNAGAYNSISRYQDLYSENDLSIMLHQRYASASFSRFFTVLQNMIGITAVKENEPSKLLMLYNCSTHEPTLLQEPEYNVQMNVDNTEYEEKMNFSRQDGRGNTVSFSTYDQIAHYQINMATIQEIGRWLDYLKENDVYDNTRIIIVADHGANLRQYDDMIFTFSDGEEEDLIKYNPLLMYKDFDDEQFKIDEQFMTNADTPSLALSGIIENPINPFTGNPIDSSKKQEGVQHLAVTNDHFVYIKRKTFPECDWISVHDDLFNIENWAECESFN